MTESRIGFVDVGARGGTSPRIAPFHDRLWRVLVEPDPVEAMRLKRVSDDEKLYSVIPVALGNVDGTIDLYVTVNPNCTSALRVNHDFLDTYDISNHFKFKETLKIECARYDTLFSLGSLPIPHAIKIDVQGFEYQVLEGFGKHLHDCLALEIETHFYPIYQDQRLFHEMVRFLSSYGFVLRSLTSARSPTLRGDQHFGGDLVEVDARFSKARKFIRSKSEKSRSDFRLACQVLDIEIYSGV